MRKKLKRAERFNKIRQIMIDIFFTFIYNWLCGVKGDFFEVEFTMDCKTKGWLLFI